MKLLSFVDFSISRSLILVGLICSLSSVVVLNGCKENPTAVNPKKTPVNTPLVAVILGDSSNVVDSTTTFLAWVTPDSLPAGVHYHWLFSDTTFSKDTEQYVTHRFTRAGIDTIRCELTAPGFPHFLTLTKLIFVFTSSLSIAVTPNPTLLTLGQTYSFLATGAPPSKLLYHWRFIGADSSEMDYTGNPVNFTVLPSRSFVIAVTVTDTVSKIVVGSTSISRVVDLPTQNVSGIIHGMTRLQVKLTGLYLNEQLHGSALWYTSTGPGSIGSGTTPPGEWKSDTLFAYIKFNRWRDTTQYGISSGSNDDYVVAHASNDGTVLVNSIYSLADSGSLNYQFGYSLASIVGASAILTSVTPDSAIYQCWQGSNGSANHMFVGSSTQVEFTGQQMTTYLSQLMLSDTIPAILEVRLYR
jgi:hypothetical protein